ncbi:MAG: hypothetical protein CVV64_14365 [Candidatus Wallbacteria bacterium HGW-Wallbacteria-1]|jgi:protoporphyrinogen oxidase|uniref:Amine oxidase domain-containing protein n=1 Tax=Candidatus Wallbacteria bacterium HGW-Wallbacteria-1 TaxID=2013854 RepID=A0A2N1PMB2_9BACT|nr:MAG: hypothetical protein CVV64_14365 [Candidatus Wallbacteria bacterium HGW-Wallbacteria-1]
MPVFSRRSFLGLGAAAIGGALGTSMLLPEIKGISNKFLGLHLPFSGEVMGEDFKAAHAMRDGTLTPMTAPDNDKILDVVIVGGGPSGLSTAMALNMSGNDNFMILEKEDVPGGLCRGNVRKDGLFYACGAHYVDYPTPQATYLHQIYQACGVMDGLHPDGWPRMAAESLLSGHEHNIYSQGQWYPEQFPYQAASEQDLIASDAFGRDTWMWTNWRDSQGRPAFCYPISWTSDDPEVRRLDGISMSEYLKRKGFNSPALEWYVNNRTLDEYGCSIHDTSAWAGLMYFSASRTGFKSMIPDSERVPRLVTWPGGLGHLTSRMAATLPADRLITGALVLRVKDEGDSVVVSWYDIHTKRHHCVRARQAVLGIPKNQLPHLIPEYREKGHFSYAPADYTSWIISVIHLKKVPSFGKGSLAWENLLHDSWTLGYVNNQHMEKGRSPDKPHILSMYAALAGNTMRERMELLTYGWDYWARLTVWELMKAHPDIIDYIEKLDIWKWGHPMLQPKVGHVWGADRAGLLKPFGRIRMGHADVCGIPVFEEVTYRGFQIAEEILAELGTPIPTRLTPGKV